MKEMFDRASDLGFENIVVGMPHRGRLNVLGNVFRKPLAQISSEFDKNAKPVEEVGFTRVLVTLSAEIIWCQEEPMNMGASSYIAPRLCTAMKATGRGSWEDIKFVGRGPPASTATGFARVHKSEQAEIVQLAMKAPASKARLLSHPLKTLLSW
uniref:2-oxoglutarate dehydrogenase E1 component/KDG C-terminal domain-containing protein n=1 Tax=Salix viminalis TaxID=40686 RepID=A0A6N2NJ29_SALVM